MGAMEHLGVPITEPEVEDPEYTWTWIHLRIT